MRFSMINETIPKILTSKLRFDEKKVIFVSVREKRSDVLSMESKLSDRKIQCSIVYSEQRKGGRVACKCVDPSCYRYFRLRFINFN